VISPTQRSLAHLRRRGALAEVVERYVKTPTGGFRRDLFKCIDIIALDGGILGIQACRGDDAATRIAKIRSDAVWPKAERWLKEGGRLEVWSWALRGPADTRKRWTLKVEAVTLDGDV
jgi:hypothetical protein